MPKMICFNSSKCVSIKLTSWKNTYLSQIKSFWGPILARGRMLRTISWYLAKKILQVNYIFITIFIVIVNWNRHLLYISVAKDSIDTYNLYRYSQFTSGFEMQQQFLTKKKFSSKCLLSKYWVATCGVSLNLANVVSKTHNAVLSFCSNLLFSLLHAFALIEVQCNYKGSWQCKNPE